MPKLKVNTTVIIGERPTEFFYLNSLKDEFRELQNIRPTSPKNTSLRELERSIESSIAMGYERIFCLIDMDNKKKDPTSLANYINLKKKYHGVRVVNPKRGVNYEIRFFETDRCTELFFLFYFRYTGQNFKDSDSIESELARICGYEKTQKFFKSHPLHIHFQKRGGNLSTAIENAIKSEAELRSGNRDYTYSEIGSMFRELGLRNRY